MEKMVIVGREISFDDLAETFPYLDESYRGQPLITTSDVKQVVTTEKDVMRFELVEGTEDTYLRKN